MRCLAERHIALPDTTKSSLVFIIFWTRVCTIIYSLLDFVGKSLVARVIDFRINSKDFLLVKTRYSFVLEVFTKYLTGDKYTCQWSFIFKSNFYNIRKVFFLYFWPEDVTAIQETYLQQKICLVNKIISEEKVVSKWVNKLNLCLKYLFVFCITLNNSYLSMKKSFNYTD